MRRRGISQLLEGTCERLISGSEENKLLEECKESANIRLLKRIEKVFIGEIRYKKTQERYILESTELESAKKIITYLNRYNLQSNFHVNYLK